MAPRIEQDLTWIAPPDNQGQGVEVDYASGEHGVYRRTRDRSLPASHAEAVEYAVAWWDDVLGPCEPWQAEPQAREWHPAVAR